jgi:hypothetical protein
LKIEKRSAYLEVDKTGEDEGEHHDGEAHTLHQEERGEDQRCFQVST